MKFLCRHCKHYRDAPGKRPKVCPATGRRVWPGDCAEECHYFVLEAGEGVPMKRYHYKVGKIIETGPGLGERYFFTRWQTESGGYHRVNSPDLPVRKTLEEAQADLDAWAAKKGLREVEEGGCSTACPASEGT